MFHRLEDSQETELKLTRAMSRDPQLFVIILIISHTPKIRNSPYQISMEMYLETEFAIIRSLLGSVRRLRHYHTVDIDDDEYDERGEKWLLGWREERRTRRMSAAFH